MFISQAMRWFADRASGCYSFSASMNYDHFWTAITVALDLSVAFACAAIAVQWARDERVLTCGPAKTAAGTLRRRFIALAVCGYLFTPVILFRRGPGLYDILVAILAYAAWRYGKGATDLKIIYGKLNDAERLADDLRELRADRERLEKRVHQRTAELETAVTALRLEIADRKRAVAVLSEERNLLHTLIDALPDLIYVKDMQGRYVLNNTAHLEFLGASSPEQIAGKTPFDLFPRELAERYHADDIRATLHGETVVRDVEAAVDFAGKARWVSRTKVPLYDPSGRTIGVVGIVRDITRRQQAEAALRESELRFRSVAQSACDAIISCGDDGQIVFWNKAAETIFGYSETEALRQYVSMLVPESARKSHRAAVASVISTEESRLTGRPLEIVGLHKSGREFPIEVSLATWKTEEGTFFSGTIRDITERKAAADALRAANETLEKRVVERSAAAEQRTQELADSERAYRQQTRILQSILDSMGEGVVVADEKGSLLLCNPSAEELLAMENKCIDDAEWKARYVPLMADKITPIPPLDRPLARAMRGEAVNEAEVFFRRRDLPGGIWLSASARPLRDEDGTSRGGVLVLRDITERKNAETELSRAKEAAEAANNAKSEFLANMSHEIRTPMTAILGFADLMLAPGQGLCDLQNYLQIIRRNGQHLLHLINDILDISKIEAGEMKTEEVWFDLPQMLAEIRLLMRLRASEKGLNFTVLFDGPIPRRVLTDPVRMKQILVNLLGNAIKFTPGGRVSLRVTCDASGKTMILRFDVADTGIGMSEEQLGQLFRAFTQADESTTRRFGGTGLGLTISRRFARMLGGDVSVTSQVGVGSTFTASIAAGPSAGIEMAYNLEESVLPEPANSQTSVEVSLKGRILLAEDGRDNQRLISAILTGAGADVTLAENGRVAVETASNQPFDLILMDMQMPELDGYGATAELRRRGSRTPIIALTAHAMAEDREKCLASGCNGYLTKPVEPEHFLYTIARHLGQTLLRAHMEKPAEEVNSPSDSSAIAERCPRPAKETGSEKQPVRSAYADVAKMQGILAEFVQDLPARVAEMLNHFSMKDLAAVKRDAHQLRGSGGGYGFPDMTEMAARVEQSIKDEKTLEVIGQEIEALAAFVRRVEGYAGDAERSALREVSAPAKEN
ncbi:MAG TPA: PAS domain S-box protein [Tepidisphaeraceae bacterium]|jgi:PAS domain S-box-containing protein|nr:PAS domain S-box protein [Tepidisphaeraceae bacterium]